jgi:hypothetical protein
MDNNLQRQRCLVSDREPFCVIEMSDDLFGYRSQELTGQSIRQLCGPWTDSLLLFCAISEACVMRSKSVELFLRDKAGSKRLCKVVCSPAYSQAGQFEGCMLFFANMDDSGHMSTRRHAVTPEAVRNTSSSPPRTHAFQMLTDLATFKETLQYQGKMKELVPNLVFDSSSAISISRLLAGPEKSISIRPRRKRSALTAGNHCEVVVDDPTSPGEDAPALPHSNSAYEKCAMQRGAKRPTTRRPTPPSPPLPQPPAGDTTSAKTSACRRRPAERPRPAEAYDIQEAFASLAAAAAAVAVAATTTTADGRL